MQVQPIGTAPAGDGWILGLLPPGAQETPRFGLRWVFCTRCDTGWHDDEGYGVEPTHWSPVPDPQPQGTGWRPAEGHVEIAAAEGRNWDWRGWMVSIVKPDGDYDELREPALEDSPENARRTAARWSALHGLTIREEKMTHAAIVIPFPNKESSHEI